MKNPVFKLLQRQLVQDYSTKVNHIPPDVSKISFPYHMYRFPFVYFYTSVFINLNFLWFI